MKHVAAAVFSLDLSWQPTKLLDFTMNLLWEDVYRRFTACQPRVFWEHTSQRQGVETKLIQLILAAAEHNY